MIKRHNFYLFSCYAIFFVFLTQSLFADACIERMDYAAFENRLANDSGSNGKYYLVYNSSPSCGNCLYLSKHVLTVDSVCSLIKEHFDFVELNYSIPEENKYAESLGMRGGPSFVILDQQGKFLHRFGRKSFKPNVLMNELEDFLLQENWTYTLDSIYASKHYSADFLRSYAYHQTKYRTLDSAVINEYVNELGASELLMKDNMEFIMRFYIDFDVNPMFTIHSKGYQCLKENRAEFKKYFSEDQINVRLLMSITESLQGQALSQLSSQEFEEILNLYQGLLEGDLMPIEDFGGDVIGLFIARYGQQRMREQFLLAKGNLKEFHTLLNTLFEENYHDPEALNTKAWDVLWMDQFFDGYHEHSLKWVKRALEIQDHWKYQENLAYQLYKRGDTEGAKKALNKAIEGAEMEGEPYPYSAKLLKKMENNEPL